jgi:hypothetical protein
VSFCAKTSDTRTASGPRLSQNPSHVGTRNSSSAAWRCCGSGVRTRECLRAHGIETQGLHSKIWGEFFGLGRPPVRFLIALSDVYAANSNWGPDTVVARWYMPDPASVAGSEIDIRLGFEEAFGTLEPRVRRLLALTSSHLTDRSLSRELTLIGDES